MARLRWMGPNRLDPSGAPGRHFPQAVKASLGR